MKKFVIIILILSVLGIGGYFLFKGKAKITPQKNISAEEAAINKAREDWNSAIKTTKAVDSDFDGLTNEEEKKYGTDSNNLDTDSDLITDGNEIKLKTNPLKADTDGDGIKDGLEIMRGTDPLKPNK